MFFNNIVIVCVYTNTKMEKRLKLHKLFPNITILYDCSHLIEHLFHKNFFLNDVILVKNAMFSSIQGKR